MAAYNPYFVDEIVTELNPRETYFGLIRDENDEQVELYGYEITLDGRVVVPHLNTADSLELAEVKA